MQTDLSNNSELYKKGYRFDLQKNYNCRRQLSFLTLIECDLIGFEHESEQ